MLALFTAKGAQQDRAMVVGARVVIYLNILKILNGKGGLIEDKFKLSITKFVI